MKKLMFSHLKVGIFIALFLVLTQPCLAGTWRDDFEDNNISEWMIFSIKKIQLNPGKPNGRWWISNGEIVGEIFNRANADTWFSLFLTGEPTWEHYSISCRAKLVKGENVHGNPPLIGLTLHDTAETDNGDEKNKDLRYMFVLDYFNKRVQFIQAAGINEIWVAWGAFKFMAEEDTWYNLTATIHKDGSVQFHINNQEIFLFKNFLLENVDISTRNGYAGLVVSNARARFDDIEITGENIRNGGPGKSFQVVPKGKLATTWSKLKIK